MADPNGSLRPVPMHGIEPMHVWRMVTHRPERKSISQKIWNRFLLQPSQVLVRFINNGEKSGAGESVAKENLQQTLFLRDKRRPSRVRSARMGPFAFTVPSPERR